MLRASIPDSAGGPAQPATAGRTGFVRVTQYAKFDFAQKITLLFPRPEPPGVGSPCPGPRKNAGRTVPPRSPGVRPVGRGPRSGPGGEQAYTTLGYNRCILRDRIQWSGPTRG